LVSRAFLAQELNAKVFSASPGDLIGPLEKDGAFQLILVEEVRRATLDPDVREAIRERIFQEWASNYLKEGMRITP
jgi:parvulin-like peptidyl-prolyl isomerase